MTPGRTLSHRNKRKSFIKNGDVGGRVCGMFQGILFGKFLETGGERTFSYLLSEFTLEAKFINFLVPGIICSKGFHLRKV